MADDIVIRAEGLGKKYVIGHEAQRERYLALRDVIAHGARSAMRKVTDMARGRIVVPGDEMEEFWALKDVSFEVRRGEVLGIIGRNGAGKSTLLKILSRITEPSEGRVTIKGRVASLLEVGTGFHPELTGRENIYLNGAILGMRRAEIARRFDEIVAFAGVETFLDTPVKRFSSGMYVRLAFAVAAHLESEILIIDEVLAVGDAEFQKKCLGKMQDVAGHGRTVLFVSHNMAAIRSLCSTGVLLDSGIARSFTEIEQAVTEYLGGPTTDPQQYRCNSETQLVQQISMLAVKKAPLSHTIALSIRTNSPQSRSVSIDICLRDSYRNPIGFASTGVFSLSKNVPIPEGTASLAVTLTTPKLAIGQYSLDIFLTDPFIEFIERIEDAIRFEIEDGDPQTIQPFQQKWGYGSVHLDVKVGSNACVQDTDDAPRTSACQTIFTR
jgi:lipopolysaccharide transport system ATP-binding protein